MSTSAFVWLGVAVGGTIGALARFAVSTGLTGWLGSGFPWGTLAVNLLGTFFLGVVGAWNQAGRGPSVLSTAVNTGLLGAFTTFSTLQWELLTYFRQGQWKKALLYEGVSVGLGLVLIWLGYAAGQFVLARSWTGRPS
ncbi:MAG: CrcB family protein [Bacillota bacterium]|nr:fluoride efflux transporter CrcB [Bacillota bacterium]REJ37785.1 MAG: fluoride efflux transporter CrcB [Bacillota bacterium]